MCHLTPLDVEVTRLLESGLTRTTTSFQSWSVDGLASSHMGRGQVVSKHHEVTIITILLGLPRLLSERIVYKNVSSCPRQWLNHPAATSQPATTSTQVVVTFASYTFVLPNQRHQFALINRIKNIHHQNEVHIRCCSSRIHCRCSPHRRAQAVRHPRWLNRQRARGWLLPRHHFYLCPWLHRDR